MVIVRVKNLKNIKEIKKKGGREMSEFWDSLKDGLSIIFNLSIIIGIVVMLIIVAFSTKKKR